MSINQLVYVSQATRKMSSIELNEILRVAKNNNQTMDVTGSLFYNGGWFLQVLEGPLDTLNALYKKIEKDPRHKNSRILYNEPAKFRTFTRWSMNMTNLEDRQADKYEQLIEVIEAAKTDRKIGAASPAVTLLKIFKE
ncbi:BLUF domain-containing protein [Undibacterium oligocarboniphilum]|uniref:BLUF domain-containing protein n=1 Tax=Undibacterium oligocarboniphilum TaxID=666702 RepID=A0A850Q860_9BURK|nr:BLUF domain-containing protein [Undibacterium oligocarboniphilum]MBC3870955.1 BLUF domain-containing protein [Undibacterium oligocarboniphilum]NVO76422.1 BLUF domain-containing protein [Undibacterium oligocarboniphilum]